MTFRTHPKRSTVTSKLTNERDGYNSRSVETIVEKAKKSNRLWLTRSLRAWQFSLLLRIRMVVAAAGRRRDERSLVRARRDNLSNASHLQELATSTMEAAPSKYMISSQWGNGSSLWWKG